MGIVPKQLRQQLGAPVSTWQLAFQQRLGSAQHRRIMAYLDPIGVTNHGWTMAY